MLYSQEAACFGVGKENGPDLRSPAATRVLASAVRVLASTVQAMARRAMLQADSTALGGSDGVPRALSRCCEAATSAVFAVDRSDFHLVLYV